MLRRSFVLLGRARALVHAGDKEGASASYTQLLRESEWEEDEAECGRGLEEARVYTSASPPQGLLAFAASEQAEPQGERGSSARIVRMGYLASSYYPDGSTAAWGHDMRLAVELAVQEFNEAVSHTPVQMELVCVVETNGSVAGLNATLARMVDAGVDAVLGADWSRVAVAAAAYGTVSYPAAVCRIHHFGARPVSERVPLRLLRLARCGTASRGGARAHCVRRRD